MLITVAIPDDFAAQVEARGLSIERYVQTLIEEQARAVNMPPDAVDRLADLESFLREMATHSGIVPLPAEQVFTRESFYQDHD